MLLNPGQIEALEGFCALILCGHKEDAFRRGQEYMENASDEYHGIPDILYLLSGQAAEPEDPYGNTASPDRQFVKPQYYFVSSDAGAPALEDFFWFIENIKEARGLAFTIDEKAFSNEDCIVEWLAELSRQLKDFCILNFDGASEDYHFTILNQKDCIKAMDLFERMTAFADGYPYTAFVITEDFLG